MFFEEEAFRRLAIFSSAEIQFARAVGRTLRAIGPEERSDTQREMLDMTDEIEQMTEECYMLDGLLGHPPETCSPQEWHAAWLLLLYQLRLEDQGTLIADAERKVQRILLSSAFPQRVLEAIDRFGFLVRELGDEDE